MGILRLQRKRCPKSKVVLAGIIALLIATVWLAGPGYKWKLRRFLNEWRSVADPESLREWAVKRIDGSDDTEEAIYLWGAVVPRAIQRNSRRPHGEQRAFHLFCAGIWIRAASPSPMT
jgi:hypothetical protein